MGAPVHPSSNDDIVSIIVSPHQTLSFKHRPDDSVGQPHDDLEYDETGKVISNHGPHISMYVADLPTTYKNAAALNAVFVNTRFKRQAYTIDEAIDQCMFRILDIIDPADVESGPILRLEHEVRSVTTADGKLYKSCPFFEIPRSCLQS